MSAKASKFSTFLGGRKVHIHNDGSKLVCVHTSSFAENITDKLTNKELHRVYSCIMKKLQKTAAQPA